MIPVLVPAYAPAVSFMTWLLTQKKVYWAKNSHYKKQTYRNRAYIYGANGRLTLTIPILHTKQHHHQKENEVHIDPHARWQTLHWKSLEAAYRSSPFFEFYEDALWPVYQDSAVGLYSFNRTLLNTLLDLLDLRIEQEEVDFDVEQHTLQTNLLEAKKSRFELPNYHQVFENKYGFISNLSILDALFNLGPETVTYLKKCRALVNPI